MTRQTLCIVMAIFVGGFAQAARADVYTWPKFIAAAKNLSRHVKGEGTSAQKELAYDELIKSIAAKFDGQGLRFVMTVKNVKWKDGVATLTLKEGEADTLSAKQAEPLHVNRNGYITLRMSQKQAASIRVDATLRGDVKLKFHLRKWGAVGVTNKQQQLVSFRHKAFAVASLGTFTASSGTYTIDGRRYTSQWE